MREFDLDAAKRGEMVQIGLSVSCWVSVHFVGVCIDGSPVVQIGNQQPHRTTSDVLRMAPKPPIEMWVQVYNYRNVNYCSISGSTPEEAIANCGPFTKLCGEPHKILVAQE